MVYNRLHQVTEWLQLGREGYSRIPRGYSGLQKVTAGYRVVSVGYSRLQQATERLQWVPESYSWLPSGYSGLQQVTAGYRLLTVG